MRIFFTILLFLPVFSFGQYAENIRTGRPGQGIGPYTLGQSVLQVQSGINYNEFNNSIADYKVSGINTVVRLGITERFEISGLINYQNEKSKFDNNLSPYNLERNGINNLQLGARVNLIKNKAWIPALGFQSRILFKLQSSEFPRNEIGLKNILVTTNKLNDKFSFMTNWILNFPGGNADLNTEYVANLSYSITNKLGVFVEIYGGLGKDATLYFDGGFSYLINKDLQLDISAGNQGTEAVPNQFIDFGLSWRYDWRK